MFVDTFIGGGLVLDSHLRAGLHGNAGAIGSMPLALAGGRPASAPPQLLSVASLCNLERLYQAAGLDIGAVADARALQAGTIGPDARALGGALLPLHANFAPDRALFLKIAAA